MRPIIVFYTDKQELSEFTSGAFGKKIDKNTFFTHNNLDVLITDNPTDIKTPFAVTVFLGLGENFKGTHLDRNGLYIVDSDDTTALELLAANGASAVVCGSSALCTVSLSSIQNGYVSISLQRAVTTYDGRKTEPQEYRQKIDSHGSLNTILLVAAFLAVIGE